MLGEKCDHFQHFGDVLLGQGREEVLHQELDAVEAWSVDIECEEGMNEWMIMCGEGMNV